MSRNVRLAQLVVLLPMLFLTTGRGADWPQFRGPAGNGISEEHGLPLTWSPTQNIAWKVAVPGLGRSSPVVLGNRIWITTAVKPPAPPESRGSEPAGPSSPAATPPAGGLLLTVLCLDRTTDTLLYSKEVFQIERPELIHDLNSHATPTPVAEPDRLYCDFGNYGTAGLDASTGRVLWKTRLPVDHQLGPGSSPVLWKERLILVRDGCDAQYVAALETSSGGLAWKTERPPFETEGPAYRKSFSTPLVIEAAGQAQAIVPGPHWVVSYDPATGKEIWRVRHGKGYSIGPRPVYREGIVYVCTGDYVAQLWAIRVDGHGDVSRTHLAWKATSQIPLMASPLAVGGELYMVSDNGMASCLDDRDGRLLWRERLGGQYAASPVYADGRVHFFNRDGTAVVLRAGRSFDRLAENRLEGDLIASPAVADHAIFIRTGHNLYCIRQQP
jgi:outer membrane protein assembly factor BamB